MTDVRVKCACGNPPEANFYVLAIVGTEDETDYFDGYFCDQHASRDMGRAAVRTLLGIGAPWRFLERPKVSHLR